MFSIHICCFLFVKELITIFNEIFDVLLLRWSLQVEYVRNGGKKAKNGRITPGSMRLLAVRY